MDTVRLRAVFIFLGYMHVRGAGGRRPAGNIIGVSWQITRSARASPNVITLERTTCFGACPAYLLQIDSSGAVSFRQGPRANPREERTSTITVDQLHDLVAELPPFISSPLMT